MKRCGEQLSIYVDLFIRCGVYPKLAHKIHRDVTKVDDPTMRPDAANQHLAFRFWVLIFPHNCAKVIVIQLIRE